MPRGQSVCTGKWNFHSKRYTCPDCNKKGLFVLSRQWLSCCYCKLLETKLYSDNYQRIMKSINLERERNNLT